MTKKTIDSCRRRLGKFCCNSQLEASGTYESSDSLTCRNVERTG